MVVAGVVLVAVAAVLVVAALFSNSTSVRVHLLGVTISDISVGVVFLVGMAVTVVAVLGIVLLVGGLRRGRRQRKQRRQLERENQRLATSTSAVDPGTDLTAPPNP